MTVRVRPYKRGGWEVDIMLTIPGRPWIRDRKKAPVSTKSAAKRWGEERERQLIQHYTTTDPSEDGPDDRPDVTTKEVPTPKGGRSRTIPLAPRLHEALVAHRHLRVPHVLVIQRGTRPAAMTVRRWVLAARRAVGFPDCGPHILRHTFCSQLAMAGKPAKAIQELAGHRSVTTTERYMHLAPEFAQNALDAFRRPPNWRHVGDGTSGVVRIQ